MKPKRLQRMAWLGLLLCGTMAQARAGLSVRTLVDKAQAVPDDVVTLTVLCRNDGPEAATGVRVEQAVPVGFEPTPQAWRPGACYQQSQRRVVWQLPQLAAASEDTLSFQATVTAAEPGTALSAAAVVRTADSPPAGGPPATTRVVSGPLVAAFCVPDVMIAQNCLPKPLIDLGAAPGQALTERLVGLGVLNGFPDGSFRPAEPVTRAQATKMIVAVEQLGGLRDRVCLTVALGRPARVTVAVTDAGGAVRRKLAQAWSLPQGSHQLLWDGKDDAGKPLTVGVYHYEVEATDGDGVAQKLDGTINIVTVQPLPRDLASSFRDVPADAWYQPYVATAEHSGIVRGYPGKLFGPKVAISRLEHTVMVVRAAGLGPDADRRMNDKLAFADAKDVPKWAVGYVAVATTDGADGDGRLYAVGYSENRFLPAQTLTRGDAAAVLERLLDRAGAGRVPASGRIARGHEVLIEGQAVAVGEAGRFRSAVAWQPSAGPLTITAR
jgi:uncharacterized repeat protein (TIGR01451 family)